MVGVALVIAPVMLASAQEEGVTLTQVCHLLPNGKAVELWVSDTSLPAHLAHGDSLGMCVTPPPLNQMIEICHFVGNDPVTLLVSADSIAAHLSHGDTIGSCD